MKKMNYFHNKYEEIKKSHFAKSIAILAGGSALAQLIIVISLPVLTRLYSPSDFDLLALYLSIVAIISVVACLRLEIAIPLASDEDKAINLVLLCFISLISIVTISAVVICIFFDTLDSLSENKLGNYLWLIPIGILATSFYMTLQYWFVRKKIFSIIAQTRITQSILGTISQITFGLISLGPLGLLLGHVIQVATGTLKLGKYFFINFKGKKNKVAFKKLVSTLYEFKRFPKYSTWEALANTISIQLPIILIAVSIDGGTAGYILLAMKVISTPLSLISGSVSQVYLSEAKSYHADGRLREFTKKTALALFKIGIVPLLLMMLLAPVLIPIIFGQAWATTGVLISWMIPWFFFQFVVSPVSMSLHVASLQKEALFLQLFGAVIRCGFVLLSLNYFQSYVAEVYALTGLFFYAFYLIVIFVKIR